MLTIVACVALTVYAGRILKERWRIDLKGSEYAAFFIGGLIWGVNTGNYFAGFLPQERVLLAEGSLNLFKNHQRSESFVLSATCRNGIWYYVFFKSMKERFAINVTKYMVVNEAATVREYGGVEMLQSRTSGLDWTSVQLVMEPGSDVPGKIRVYKNFFDRKKSRAWWYLIAMPAPVEEIDIVLSHRKLIKRVTCDVLLSEYRDSLARK